MEVLVPVSIKDVGLLWFFTVMLGLTRFFCEGKQPPVRYEDIPFKEEMKILNKTITCGGKHWGKFAYRGYTCDDIKVDGLRLAYGYYPGWGVAEHCQEEGGRQEFAQLCRMMMKKMGKHAQDYFAAFINNATCQRIEEKRLMLVRKTEHLYGWVSMGPGNGWLSSISCMYKS